MTRAVKVENIFIGGGFPVSVQTMWKEPLLKIDEEIVNNIEKLKKAGCDIIRFAVPDIGTAEVLADLNRKAPLPLVADIHFDYKIALKCIENKISKIRINPGNIGAAWKVEEVVRAASSSGIPIRVGVNSGSLPAALKEQPDRVKAVLAAAEMEMEVLEKLNFKDVVFSLKASDIKTTVEANTLFSERYDYPLHLGVTEAGPLIPGIVKSTIAISSLLSRGIGDTIRVSLSDAPYKEVIAGKEILAGCGKRDSGIKIVSCPRCGRAGFDVHGFVAEVEDYLYSLEKDITVAVMGCVVNGPGEAKHADLGISGSGKDVLLFRKGKILRKISAENAAEEFIKEIERL